MTTFTHSGKLGDIIYCLPAMAAAGGGRLLFSPASERLIGMELSEEHLEFMRTLLLDQDCVHEVGMHHGRGVHYCFNGFRDAKIQRYGRNLVHLHADAIGVKLPELVPPWLKAPAIRIPHRSLDVIVNRTRRYKNRFFPWHEVWNKYKGRMAFIGDDLDHWEFESDFGTIPRIHVNSALDMSEQIASSKLFIGGQSLPLAIAIGLGQNVVHEISQHCPNCNFGRDNEWASGGGYVYLPDLEEL